MALYILIGGLFAIALADLAGIETPFTSKNDDDSDDSDDTPGAAGTEGDTGGETAASFFLQSDGGEIEETTLEAGATSFEGSDENDILIFENSEGLIVDPGLGSDYVRAPLGTDFVDDDAEEDQGFIVGDGTDTFVIDVTDEALAQEPPLVSNITYQGSFSGSDGANTSTTILFNLPEDTELFSYVELNNNAEAPEWTAQIYVSESPELAREDLAGAQLIANITLVEELEEGQSPAAAFGIPKIGFSNGVEGIFQDPGLSDFATRDIGDFSTATGNAGEVSLLDPDDLIAPPTNEVAADAEATVTIETNGVTTETNVSANTPVDERTATAGEEDDLITVAGDPGLTLTIDPGFGDDTVNIGLGDTILEQEPDSLRTFGEPGVSGFTQPDGDDVYNLTITPDALSTSAGEAGDAPPVTQIEFLSEGDVLNVTLPEGEGWSLHAVGSLDQLNGEGVGFVNYDLTLYASQLENPTRADLEAGVGSLPIAEVGLGMFNGSENYALESGLLRESFQNSSPNIVSNVPVGLLEYVQIENGEVQGIFDGREGGLMDFSAIVQQTPDP